MSSSSPQRFQSIGVFGGAYPGKSKVFAGEAIRLGEVLSRQNIQLVYGGGSTGLTGLVAKEAGAGGSRILGIVPRFLHHVCGPTLGKEVLVWSIPERISIMHHAADAFIALPGGLGMLEEVACMASWSSLVLVKKPVGLLNVDGYFDDLLSFLDKAVESGFMFKAARDSIVSATTAESLLERLQQYKGYPRLTEVQPSSSGRKEHDTDKDGVSCSLSL
jgi:cytokinin riboside 5'-monophosphate phosphoribohydrolase